MTIQPMADKALELTKPRRGTAFFSTINGLDLGILIRRGTPEDLNAVRIQGIWKVASMVLDGCLITAAAGSLIGGGITPASAAVGAVSAAILLQLDRTLTIRSYYQAGKRGMIRAGAKLGFEGEDIAYAMMLANRLVIGGCKAVLLGTVAAQIAFAPEIRAYNEKSVATINAPVLAAHERVIDDDLKNAYAEEKRDSDTEREIGRQTNTLRQRDLANSRSAGRRGTEERRQLTEQQLEAYEGRGTTAHEKASRSARIYEDLLAHREETLRRAVGSDPRFVPPPQGFLANTTALESIARNDPYIAAGIGLFNLLLIAVELWGLIGLIAACPTIFSINLLRDFMVRRNTIAREMVAILNNPHPGADGASDREPSDTNNEPGLRDSPGSHPMNGSGPATAPIPPRRPRGRPRGSRKNLIGRPRTEDTTDV
jgi:hypothetical protein